MKTLLEPNRLVLMPEDELEQLELASWKKQHDDFVFIQGWDPSHGAMLVALGPRQEACREPINITSASPYPANLIANFAPTPFVLDGARYACVEAFWQALRFPLSERKRIAMMDGPTAKQESARYPYGDSVIYAARTIPVGTHEHWDLMRRACRAKFEQNENALAALLATGSRPLTHVMQPDSPTIPGVVMADIWMKHRTELQGAHSHSKI